MQNLHYRVVKFLRVWRAARQERQLLFDILGKPSDRLLLDAGITREDALKIVRGDLVASVNPAMYIAIRAPRRFDFRYE